MNTSVCGEGATPTTPSREALSGLIAEFGVPQELTLTLDVALISPAPPCGSCRSTPAATWQKGTPRGILADIGMSVDDLRDLLRASYNADRRPVHPRPLTVLEGATLEVSG
ncbi:MAG TPA: hypothetical protein VGM75_26580 [Pseudonocardiaceae bacterium]